MVYVNSDGTIGQKPEWSISRIFGWFWGILNFLYMFVWTLFNPGGSSNGSRYSTDYRPPGGSGSGSGGSGGSGGPRPNNRFRTFRPSGGPDPPPCSGCGCG